MPSLSGDLFTLGADAGFEEGFVTGRVGGRAGATFDVSAEICHGINLRADAQIGGQVEGKLTVLLPSLRAEGQAFASAGVAGQIKIDPNLFDQFGLTGNLEAAAEAAVAGRIALGLDAEVLAELGLQVLDGLAAELFLVFLREVTIEAGVWGKAAYSAMARGYVEINGNLLNDEDAGFHLGGGYAVGLEGGYGVDYFVGINFDNVRRFYIYAVDRITEEIVLEMRRQLPPRAALLTELVELLLPICLNSAYDLGQKTVLGTITTPEQAIVPFLQAVAEGLQKWLLDKLSQLADRLVSQLLDQTLTLLYQDQLSAGQRADVHASVDALIPLIGAGRPDINLLADIIGHLVNIADALGETDGWQREITLLWTTVACANAVRNITAEAGLGGTVLGFGAHVRAFHRPMPAVVPDLVQTEYAAVLGGSYPAIGFDDAIDYLVEVGLEPELRQHLPELVEVLDQLTDLFEITAGDIVEFSLRGGMGTGVSDTDLYLKLRDYCRQQIDGVVLGRVFPILYAYATADEALLYLDEVARPAFRLLSDFIFERLDALAGNPASLNDIAFFTSFGEALSAVIYKIFVRNVVVIDQVLSQTIYAGLSAGFGLLEDEVRSNATGVLVTDTLDNIADYLPIPEPTPDRVAALQAFLGELFAAGQESFGLGVMSAYRLNRLRELKLAVLESIGGQIDWTFDKDMLQTSIDNFTSCTFIPDEAALRQLVALQLEILGDQAAIALRRVPPALITLGLALTAPTVAAIEEGVRIWVDQLEQWWLAAQEAAAPYLALAAQAHERAREHLEAWEEALEDAEDALSADSLLDDIVDALESQGEANLQAAASAIGLGGPLTDSLIAAFVDGTFPAAEVAFRPLIRAALDAMAAATGALADVIAGALSADEAMTAFGDDLVVALTGGGTPAAFLVEASIAGYSPFTALTGSDFEAIVRAVAGDEVADYLSTAWTERAAAAADAAAAEGYEAQAEAEGADERRDDYLAEAGTGQVAVHIASPISLDLDGRNAWVYPATVPVVVSVTGARAGYLAADVPRLFVSLNGQALDVPALGWTVGDGGARLQWHGVLTPADHGVRPGMNTLEVSVADGTDHVARAMAVFIVDLAAEGLSGPLVVRPDLSVFNTPGDDHRHAVQETVVFEWQGAGDLDLTGWRLMDASGRHRYHFGPLALAAGTTLAVHSGGDPADNTVDAGGGHVYWGRRAAVWNNRGDVVRLVDRHGVLRCSYVYPER